MKAVGPCCDWETFWESFLHCWNKQYRPLKDNVPQFIERRAEHYWRVYGMIGHEALHTIRRKVDAGKL